MAKRPTETTALSTLFILHLVLLVLKFNLPETSKRNSLFVVVLVLAVVLLTEVLGVLVDLLLIMMVIRSIQ
jgi:hypothetical protein